MIIYDVVIIGFGPTGATLANLLALQGLSVLVVERETQLYNLPRAVHFDDEVMRVFQTIGIADFLLPLIKINPGMKFVDEEGNLILDWPRPKAITSQGWNASYRLHQPDLERLLRQKLMAYEAVTIEPSATLISIDQTGSYATIHVQKKSRSTTTQYCARFVVGCDGANSRTRDIIGSSYDDYGFQERWLVLDLILKNPRPDLGDHSIQFCRPDRPMTYCRGPGLRRRWELTLLDSEDELKVIDPVYIWSMLKPWLNPSEAELERSAVYTFKSQVVKRWRDGRILIAGDAAHLTPPFLGQGMCMGIRDAYNLGWKISATIKQGLGHKLLDTYADERIPHARAYVETAIKIGQVIKSINLDRTIQRFTEDDAQSGTMRSIMPKLGPSSLSAPTSKPTSNVVGRPARQFRLQPSNELIDNITGYKHIIVSTKQPVGLDNSIFWIDASQQDEAMSFLFDLKAEAAWIRPDRYLGATTASLKDLYKCLPDFIKKDKWKNADEISIT